MNDRARRKAFVVSAACVVALTTLFLSLPGGRSKPSAAPPEPTTRSATARIIRPPAGAAPAAKAAPTAEPVAGDSISPLRPVAERHASRFARAYLRWVDNRGRSAATRALRTLATPALADDLLSTPPRSVRGGPKPAAGTLLGLDIVTEDGRTFAFEAVINRDGIESRLGVTVARDQGRWLVTGLG